MGDDSEKPRLTVRDVIRELMKSESLDAEVTVTCRNIDNFGVVDVDFIGDDNTPTLTTD